jgi:hypothetical protein
MFVLIFLISLAIASIPSDDNIKLILSTHNFYRDTVDPPATYMPSLTWHSSLANRADNWAKHCYWGYSGTFNVGENIYATTFRTNPDNFNPNMAANFWGTEKIYYKYDTNTC